MLNGHFGGDGADGSGGRKKKNHLATSTQWQLAHEAAGRYERILVPAILGPFAQALVAQSNLQSGEVVADIGCGTGAAARFAAEYVAPSGRVIGVDINAGMIEVAKSQGVQQAVIDDLKTALAQFKHKDGLRPAN